MDIPPTQKSEAVKAAGEAAQKALKSIVKDAVKEALQESDYGKTSDSSSGAGRSLLLLGAGVAVGYLLAKRSPSWLSSAEESIGEQSSTQIDKLAEAVIGSGESESESGYDANEMDEETRVGSGTNTQRPDIESATDEGTADVGSDTDEATNVNSDADEYGTEDTNIGPGGEDYGASGAGEGTLGSDEDEGASE